MRRPLGADAVVLPVVVTVVCVVVLAAVVAVAVVVGAGEVGYASAAWCGCCGAACRRDSRVCCRAGGHRSRGGRGWADWCRQRVVLSGERRRALPIAWGACAQVLHQCRRTRGACAAEAGRRAALALVVVVVSVWC